jgi:hypothetical protein
VVGEEEHAVMESWEHPYMEHLAQIATRNGGWVLEVGFGLGISGTMLQKKLAEYKDANPEKEIKHVIIEINAEAIEEGERWKNGEGVWASEQGGPGPQPYKEVSACSPRTLPLLGTLTLALLGRTLSSSTRRGKRRLRRSRRCRGSRASTASCPPTCQKSHDVV